MTDAWDKDAWIRRAILSGLLRPQRDGRILRRDVRSKTPLYREVEVSTHKKTGRIYFTLTFESLTKSVLVNRVIALAFLPNPFKLPQVNHLDGDKAHNALTNLEWSSRTDNEKHAHANGLKSGRGSQNANAKLSADIVMQIRISSAPAPSLAERFGVSERAIRDVIERKTWAHV